MTLGILCPGQGSQHAGMLDMLRGDPAALAVLDRVRPVLGADPAALVAGPPAELHRNAMAQPLLCAVQLATWTALRPHLPPVRAFAGYSLGELAAYGCADALDSDALFGLAQQRAALMDGACPVASGLMAVRGLDRPAVDRLCRDFGLEIAIINDTDRMVVGGRRDALSAFEPAALAQGAGLTPLPVAVASHTSLMAPAAVAFGQALATSSLRAPAVPVLAGIDGSAVQRRDQAVAMLSRQIATTINWAACIDALAERGCTLLLELGPGSALSPMVRDRRPDVTVRSVADFRTLAGVVNWVARQA